MALNIKILQSATNTQAKTMAAAPQIRKENHGLAEAQEEGKRKLAEVKKKHEEHEKKAREMNTALLKDSISRATFDHGLSLGSSQQVSLFFSLPFNEVECSSRFLQLKFGMTMETNREKEARPKHQRKPYIPKEWITGVDKDEFLAIVDKHLPQKDYSNVSVGTWTKIGNECLLEFGLGKEETQKRSWQDNIGYITKCYARETFGLEIPTQDKIRRAFKKLEGKPLFDNIDIKKIVEEVKERHLATKLAWKVCFFFLPFFNPTKTRVPFLC